MKKNGFGKFIAGAAVGAGLGLLFAPKTGKETREVLKKKIDEVLEQVKSIKAEDVKDDVKSKLDALDEPVVEPETQNSEVYEKVDEDLEELTQKEEPVKTEKEKVEDDDTLENDLFDLIDSMYDNREDGDI